MKRKTGFTTHAQGPSESGVEIWLWLVLGVGPAELRCTCLRQQAEPNPNQHANGRLATPLPLLPRVPAASRGRSKEVLLPVVWYKGRSRRGDGTLFSYSARVPYILLLLRLLLHTVLLCASHARAPSGLCYASPVRAWQTVSPETTNSERCTLAILCSNTCSCGSPRVRTRTTVDCLAATGLLLLARLSATPHICLFSFAGHRRRRITTCIPAPLACTQTSISRPLTCCSPHVAAQLVSNLSLLSAALTAARFRHPPRSSVAAAS
jgi:hypothetical protein